jgi:hypothetical protein
MLTVPDPSSTSVMISLEPQEAMLSSTRRASGQRLLDKPFTAKLGGVNPLCGGPEAL